MSALRCTAGHWCVRWQPIHSTALNQKTLISAVLMVHVNVCGWTSFINNEKEAALTTTRPGLTLERAFVARSTTSPMAGQPTPEVAWGHPRQQTRHANCCNVGVFTHLHTGGAFSQRCHYFLLNSGLLLEVIARVQHLRRGPKPGCSGTSVPLVGRQKGNREATSHTQLDAL
jgi:hypothetical protein